MAVYSTREIKKWDVYYIESPVDSYSGSIGRPAIILSPDRRNDSASTCVTVVFLTTAPNSGSWYPTITSSGRRSYAKCSEITTLRRELMGTYLCTLKDAEIAAVKKALVNYLELDDAENALGSVRIENEELQKRIAELEAKNAEAAAELEKKDLDCKVFEAAYRKVLDRLADQQIEKDLAKPRVKVEEVTPVVEEIELEPIPPLVNINTCTESELMKLGVSFSVARNITAARPFLKYDDLRIVPGLTRIAFGILEKKVTLGDTSEYLPKKKKPEPVVVEEPAAVDDKVNLNTCTWKELHERLGVGNVAAQAITGYRKTHGLYSNLEEVMSVPRVTKVTRGKLEGKVCFG